jgi:8-oxo-dGTP pyrophosphatase MutT (NUDIX family)
MAVVRRGGRILMICRGPAARMPGYWAPPSGRVEPGERQEDAVVREVREEVGLRVSPIAKVWESETHDGSFRLHWWTAEAGPGDVRPAPLEVADARWIRPEGFEDLEPTFEGHREFFARILPTLANDASPPDRPSRLDDLAPLVEGWPPTTVAVGVTSPHTTLGVAGDPGWVTRIASVTKLLVGMAAVVAIEEEAIELDEPAGPEGSTVRHLLSHASGLAFDQHRSIARPGRRRIYSNAGIEVFADHLAERTGMPFEGDLRLGVLEPLGMGATGLRGSPAHAVWSTVGDLLLFARELLSPTLVAPETLAEATRPHFPDLAGVVPGLGKFDPNPWGLTFEIKGQKRPYWTGERNSPRTYGHFGGAGTFLWVDPDVDIALVALTDLEFGPWALEAWPALSDAILDRYAST